MRLLRVGVLVATAPTIVLACASFGTDGVAPATPDGGGASTSSSSSSSGDATPAPLEGGSGVDAGGDASECFDFHDSKTNGFTTRGTATPTADGYKVVVNSKDTENAIRRTFTLDAGITTSRVAFDVKGETTKAFAGDEYADALTLYYGLPASYGASPDTSLTQFEAVANGNVDVNIWDQAGGGGYNYFSLTKDKVSLISTGDLVVIDTHWPAPGKHAVSNGTNVVNIQFSLAKTMEKELTIEIGGRQGSPGGPPVVTYTLHRLCVEIH